MTRTHKIANLIGVPLPLIGVVAAIVLLWNRAVGPLELDATGADGSFASSVQAENRRKPPLYLNSLLPILNRIRISFGSFLLLISKSTTPNRTLQPRSPFFSGPRWMPFAFGRFCSISSFRVYQPSAAVASSSFFVPARGDF